ncbi:N-acetylmuramoyl-L-alanine amidase [Orenia metallireducens]|jgi:N-acetylmuramoyl-L-alanine amidase|uniref:N-acetylmuramoyl-L-alanine amidase n=1 Tax=Orenia metallireducens TaxID=1413210 RepID=A0A285H5M8_9FIRM|nr:N-acetylmuramoyl-L-alanine amidase family protein [Orenia metallireducens]PRX17801.1 N-acetylmuramoyl-L-alanine amidase [Orenia metallireducens]SNY31140.1 N-acetylmuramoyl-L-alanine amidase [Orenia metallireducens]
MPKQILVLTLIFLLITSISIRAEEDDDIRLMINGDLITDQLDYRIVDNSILIPLEMLTDNLSIKMKWFTSIDTIQLDKEGKVIKFRVGDKHLQVDNQIIKMDTKVISINEKIMVPIKDMGDALGLTIKSYPEQRIVKISETKGEIKDVDYPQTDDYEGLELLITEEVDYDVQFFSNPLRMVLDIKGATITPNLDKPKVDSDLIKDYHISQLDNNTKVIIDLYDNIDYNIEQKRDGDEYKYLVKLSPIINSIKYDGSKIKIGATRPLNATKVSYLSNPSRVVIDIKNAALEKATDLKVEDKFINKVRLSQFQTKPYNIVRAVLDLEGETRVEVENNGGTLEILPLSSQLLAIDYDLEEGLIFRLSNQVEPEVLPLLNGDRLVFDFPLTVNNIKEHTLQIDDKLIEEIRVSQFNKEKSRVVVDLTKLVPYELEWKDNNLQVKLVNNLTGVDLEKKKLKQTLKLSLLKAREYKVYKLVNPNRLVIDIFDTIVDLNQIELPKVSGIIKDIRVSQYSTDPKQVRVALELEKDLDFEIKSESITDKIEVDIIEERFRSYLKNKVIVVDAGHGGRDPGAIGYSGAREKDLILDVALKLEKLLEDGGAEVIMTRKTDEYIELTDRSKLANDNNADIFVSLHLNSHVDEQYNGTETYIRPNYDQANLLLANLTQRALLKELGTFDRGVKANNLKVLDTTNMPAVLNEIAFLSNQEEEVLLMSEEFREKAAIALYKGINNYFRLLAEEEF